MDSGNDDESELGMNYANIKYCDIANGPGVRTSVFVSGCRLHCPGCFNEVAWSFSSGEPFDEDVQTKVIESLRPSYVHGLTVLGGEPMEPENQEGLLPFLRRVKVEYPEKTIWCFTGYVLDDILHGGHHLAWTDELLEQVDVLVDGPYKKELHQAGLRFRGSTNQRIIDVPATLRAWRARDAEEAAMEPVPWADDPAFARHSMG